MEKIITIENIRHFAYCNANICTKPIRGLVISFFGLGGAAMYNEDTEDGRKFGKKVSFTLFQIKIHGPG